MAGASYIYMPKDIVIVDSDSAIDRIGRGQNQKFVIVGENGVVDIPASDGTCSVECMSSNKLAALNIRAPVTTIHMRNCEALESVSADKGPTNHETGKINHANFDDFMPVANRIETLYMRRSTTKIIANKLPYLRRAKIESCRELQEFKAFSKNLEKLEFKDCPNLTELSYKINSNMKLFKIRRCPNLMDDSIPLNLQDVGEFYLDNVLLPKELLEDRYEKLMFVVDTIKNLKLLRAQFIRICAMQHRNLLDIAEATLDVNTALDECLPDSFNARDVLNSLLSQREYAPQKPNRQCVDETLRAIHVLKNVGDSAERIESDISDGLRTWGPMLREVNWKRRQLCVLVEHQTYLKHYLEVQNALKAEHNEVDTLLRFLSYVKSCTHSDTLVQAHAAQVFENAIAPLKGKLEASIKTELKVLKWPIASEAYGSTEKLCSSMASLVLLQVVQALMSDDAETVNDQVTKEEYTGDLWAVQLLSKPIELRFLFHFGSDRPTNRLDRPEWFIGYVLQAARDSAGLIEERLQPQIAERSALSPFKAVIVDLLSHFVRALVRRVHSHLQVSWPMLDANDDLLCHTIDEVIAGDRVLAAEFGYGMGSNSEKWPYMIDFISKDDKRSMSWIRCDLKYAQERLSEALASPSAWNRVSVSISPDALGVVRAEDMDDQDALFVSEAVDAFFANLKGLGSRLDLYHSEDGTSESFCTKYVEGVHCNLIRDFANSCVKLKDPHVKFNTLYITAQLISDMKLNPKYAMLQSAVKSGNHLMFAGGLAHSATLLSPGSLGDEKTEAEWVFARHLQRLQNMLDEEIEVEISRVVYEISDAFREWDRKNWVIESRGATDEHDNEEVSQEARNPLTCIQDVLLRWSSQIVSVVYASLATKFAERVETHVLETVRKKRFSAAGARQLLEDCTALQECFKKRDSIDRFHKFTRVVDNVIRRVAESNRENATLVDIRDAEMRRRHLNPNSPDYRTVPASRVASSSKRVKHSMLEDDM